MKVALCSFVKTPGSSPVKTRLAKDIGKEKAEEIYLELVSSVKKLFGTLKDIDCYFAVGEEENLNHPVWQNFKTIHSGEGDLGERLNHVYSRLKQDYELVIIIGSDSPEINEEDIKETVKLASENKENIVIGPSHDGGFYLFAGRDDIHKKSWLEVEYSSDQTLKELVENLDEFEIKYLRKLVDVDDLESLGMTEIR